MQFSPTWDSLAAHAVPAWYDDAKLGVFLHWGLYSVPAWAPRVGDIQRLLAAEGPVGMLRRNPYAEWYLNSMRIKGSPTWKHHRNTYGAGFAYDDFRTEFDDRSREADADALAGVCAAAGARYVVLTTKHHDGFTLWPSRLEHPRKGFYHAERDLVGAVTDAVRGRGMRMGLYYSGGYDWPFNDAMMSGPADAMLAVPGDGKYAEYAAGHVRELIDDYAPSILWNDICWPPHGNLAELFAYYYNTVADGVVNDRWAQQNLPRNTVVDTLVRGAGTLVQAGWRFLPESSRRLTFPAAPHHDFTTPEYAAFDEIQDKKWEATRGVGHSFALNRNERPQDVITAPELVRLLCDVVAKNGNLLLGIGPDPSGAVPQEQLRPLRELGAWLKINGEAIYGSRPWTVAATTTTEGTGVRFTRAGGRTYAMLTEPPAVREFALHGVRLGGDTVRVLGKAGTVSVDTPAEAGPSRLTLPPQLPVSPVTVLDLGASAEWVSVR